jgi:hypothetical protein
MHSCQLLRFRNTVLVRPNAIRSQIKATDLSSPPPPTPGESLFFLVANSDVHTAVKFHTIKNWFARFSNKLKHTVQDPLVQSVITRILKSTLYCKHKIGTVRVPLPP